MTLSPDHLEQLRETPDVRALNDHQLRVEIELGVKRVLSNLLIWSLAVVIIITEIALKVEANRSDTGIWRWVIGAVVGCALLSVMWSRWQSYLLLDLKRGTITYHRGLRPGAGQVLCRLDEIAKTTVTGERVYLGGHWIWHCRPILILADNRAITLADTRDCTWLDKHNRVAAIIAAVVGCDYTPGEVNTRVDVTEVRVGASRSCGA